MFSKSLALFAPLIVTLTLSAGQFLYEGVETNQNKQPTKHNRQPIESDKCLEGEFLYPGDNDKDWACDCKPIHVYHPQTMKCYPVYEQGPCKNGEILVLSMKKSTPQCIRNTCTGKKVSFRSKCVNLTDNGGCPGHSVVLVNSTSLQLTCAIDFSTRFSNDDDPLQKATPIEITQTPVDDIGAICLLAGKRSQDNKCVST